MMTVIFWASGIMLTLAALLTLGRMVVGPTVLNRALATDAIVAIIVCALGLEALVTKDAWTLPLLITLSLLGFLGSVAIARFAARDVDEGFTASMDGPLPARYPFAKGRTFAQADEADSLAAEDDEGGRS